MQACHSCCNWNTATNQCQSTSARNCPPLPTATHIGNDFSTVFAPLVRDGRMEMSIHCRVGLMWRGVVQRGVAAWPQQEKPSISMHSYCAPPCSDCFPRPLFPEMHKFYWQPTQEDLVGILHQASFVLFCFKHFCVLLRGRRTATAGDGVLGVGRECCYAALNSSLSCTPLAPTQMYTDDGLSEGVLAAAAAPHPNKMPCCLCSPTSTLKSRCTRTMG